MKCCKCGRPIGADDAFCALCGAKQVVKTANPKSCFSAPAELEKTPKNKDSSLVKKGPSKNFFAVAGDLTNDSTTYKSEFVPDSVFSQKKEFPRNEDDVVLIKRKQNESKTSGKSVPPQPKQESSQPKQESSQPKSIPAQPTSEYDIYISHKSNDIAIAEEMYYFMKQNGKRVFYDKKSLPERSESQYRKSIMHALDKSSHFVVVLSDLSYMESYWVKLEMQIFQSEIDEGRKKNSNFIMVVTKNVHDQIMESNKAVLPIDFRRCEIMLVEEYKAKLLMYIR